MKSILSITLFHKEFKTLLPAMLIVTLILCFTLPYAHVGFVKTMAYLTEKNDNPNLTAEERLNKEQIIDIAGGKIKSHLARANFLQLLLAFMFPLLMGTQLLCSERKYNTMDMLITMPYSRIQLILSKVLAGLLILVIPYALIYGICVVQHQTIADVSSLYNLHQLSQWFFNSIIPLFLMFAVGVFVSTLVSPFIGSFLIGSIFSIFGIGFAIILHSNLQFFNIKSIVLNKISEVAFVLSPFSYLVAKTPLDLLSDYNISNTQVVIFNLVFAAILLGAAVILYKRNPLENNHELLMFQSLNPLFVAGMTVCMALTLAPMIHASIGGQLFILFIGHIIGGLAGFLLSRYYIKRVRASA